jgi:hypothetical protein
MRDHHADPAFNQRLPGDFGQIMADRLYPKALVDDRIGAGHPEGLFEAWSNLYYRFALAPDATERGDPAMLKTLRYPDIHADMEGVRWVANCGDLPMQEACWSIIAKMFACSGWEPDVVPAFSFFRYGRQACRCLLLNGRSAPWPCW